MRKIAMLASAVLLSTPLAACNWPAACEGLEASERDKEAAAEGYEVEREDSSGNTCELSQDGKTWAVDD